MKLSTAVAMVVLALVLPDETFAASPEGTAAEARKTLEAARAALASAVQRIQKDPPTSADLDAAHAAVGALKDAIDAGASYEPQDLAYATSALAARKELRTHRPYVDQRRANLHIHNARRALDEASATLEDRAKRVVDGKETSAEAFNEARAAATALRKAVQDARPLVQQEPKLASHLDEVDARAARHQEAIDAKWTQLTAHKQRGLVEEARRQLTTAMTSLGAGSSDAQFDAARRTASVLGKQLEDGKVLESRDATYAAESERGRADLAAARTKLDKLWSEVGLARVKAEVEPAHQALAEAGRALEGKKPSEEQLAEARTATLVVRKLLEKYQSQAEHHPALATYSAEVKKTLTGVEGTIQREKLEAAEAAVTQGLRGLVKRAPSAEDFQTAEGALARLEKEIGASGTGSPALSHARASLRDGRASLAKRRSEVDVQGQRATLAEARTNATAKVRALQGRDTGNKELEEAGEATEALNTALEAGAPLTKKDGDYAKYHQETKERLAELKERIASRKVALAVAEGRGVLDESLAQARSGLEAASKPLASDAEVEGAVKALDTLRKELDARKPLEKQDRGHADRATRMRGELAKLEGRLELAQQAQQLRQQTSDALTAGAAAAEASRGTTELRARRKKLEEAVTRFRSCETAGTRALAENPALAKSSALLEGQPSTVKDVVAKCAERAHATQGGLTELVGLIGFEDGPKKSFEAGKALLTKSQKTEALAQFDECIASGRILAHRNPETKARTFEVAGASMTLEEVIKQCGVHQGQLRQRPQASR